MYLHPRLVVVIANGFSLALNCWRTPFCEKELLMDGLIKCYSLNANFVGEVNFDDKIWATLHSRR